MSAEDRLKIWNKIRFIKALNQIAQDFPHALIHVIAYEPTLQERLQYAVDNENYEEAAILRDKINQLSK